MVKNRYKIYHVIQSALSLLKHDTDFDFVVINNFVHSALLSQRVPPPPSCPLVEKQRGDNQLFRHRFASTRLGEINREMFTVHRIVRDRRPNASPGSVPCRSSRERSLKIFQMRLGRDVARIPGDGVSSRRLRWSGCSTKTYLLPHDRDMQIR